MGHLSQCSDCHMGRATWAAHPCTPTPFFFSAKLQNLRLEGAARKLLGAMHNRRNRTTMSKRLRWLMLSSTTLGCSVAVDPEAGLEPVEHHTAPFILVSNDDALDCRTDEDAHPELEDEEASDPVTNPALGEMMDAIFAQGRVPGISFDAEANAVISIATGQHEVSVFALPSGLKAAEPLVVLERSDATLRTSLAERSGTFAPSQWSPTVSIQPSTTAALEAATLSWPDGVELGGDLKAEAVTAQAAANALEGLAFPADMPPLQLPEFESCSAGEQDAAIRAWALSHHHVWRLWQLIEFLGEAGTYKDDWWVDGYDPDKPNDNWSPRAWFGSYKGYRFEAIRRVVNEYWSRFRTGKLNGTTKIHIKCTPTDPGNVCNTTSTWGHHWVVGYVNLCQEFFDAAADNDPLAVQTVLHEVLHHAWVRWTDTVPRMQMIGDVHVHGHDFLCLNADTDYMVNAPDALHLAATESCFHRNIGMRNVANYALNAQRLGDAVMSGALHHFPITPPPPSNSGQSGNECSTDLPGGGSQDAPECFKVGQEWVCLPGAGAGGPIPIPSDCLLMETPFNG